MSGTIEEFDDDTDFALPSAPVASSASAGPGAGAQGDQMAQLQQMMAQMGGGGGGAGGAGGPSGGIPPQLAQMMSQMGGGGGGAGPGGPGMGAGMGADLPSNPTLSAEEKKWTTLYPIYFDAKRPFRKGARRVKLEHSSVWPTSEALADAVQRLRLLHAHEPRKTHPSDWENPGRVKVQLFDDEDGKKPVNKTIASKQDLIREVASMIQKSCGGKPAVPNKATAPAKKKAEEKKNKSVEERKTRVPARRRTQRLLPHTRIDPKSAPPMAQRYPITSPAREVGMLNADFGNMLGGMEGMGPLGAMMGQMGLGGGDDDEDEEGAAGPDAQDEAEEQKKKKDPMQNLSRRQRKKVIRIGGR